MRLADWVTRQRSNASALIASAALAASALCAAAPAHAQLLGGLLDLQTGGTTSGPVIAAPGTTCDRFSTAVALYPGAPRSYHVVSWLCRPNHPIDNPTVQLLVPGGGYNHTYWDFPYHPETYSYVWAANAAGYITLVIDRIGTGQSDHPDIVDNNEEVSAYVVHQLVTALRTGRMDGVYANRVVLVGHSYASSVSLTEASTYRDVDGVVASSYLHTLNPTAMATFGTSLIPTQLDPKWSQWNLPLGYLTPINGSNQRILYVQSNTDPEVLALDDVNKEVTCPGELGTFFASVPTGLDSRNITVPVLAIDGAEDQLFLPAVAGDPALSAAGIEPTYYPPAAQLEIVLVPNAGHNIALHLNAQQAFASILEWINRRFGPSA